MTEFLSFHLTDSFVEPYSELQPRFGFDIGGGNSLGELIYLSKYSRLKDDGTKERWYETCRRCVEGMFSILRDHTAMQRTPWNEFKAQKSAQDAYDRMFKFKWTPPGRGLWTMGTPLVHHEQHSTPLQNCAFLSTAKLSTHSTWSAVGPFVRCMEMAMWGIGVGADLRGANKLTIHQPKGKTEEFVVPDDREGWAESVGVLLESFFFKNRGPVAFDYSLVRPEGTPLKRFGGHASGPQPLIDCHETIRTQLEQREGELLDSRDIADIINKIGKAVQAGGTRRSAQILFGDPDDKDYVNIKNWNLLENVERTGEDGWAWNCLPGDTWIQTDQGSRQISDLVGTPFTAIVNGKPFDASGFTQTGMDVPVYRIETDKGYSITATDNHPFATPDGWKRLDELSDGDLVQLNEHGELSWEGTGNYVTGYLLGHLWGDGALSKGTGQGVRAVISLYGDEIDLDWMQDIEMMMSEIESPAKFYGVHGGAEVRIGSKILGSLAKEFGMTIGNKKLDANAERIGSSEFWRGFLSAAFDTDGCVQVNPFPKSKFTLVLSQADRVQLEMLQRVLLRLGIFCSIRKGWKGGQQNFMGKVYNTKPSWSLAIGSLSADRFMERIGLRNPKKRARANSLNDGRRAERNKSFVRVTSIIPAGSADVYDTTVEDLHAFDANGFLVHNSNNSVFAENGMEYKDLVDQIAVNGEPGFLWLDSARQFGRMADPPTNKDYRVMGANPCNEQSLEDQELCTLVETYPIFHDSLDDYKQTLKAAYLYGKAVTLLPTRWAESNEVMARNRRIGCSMSGLAQFVEDRGWIELRTWMDQSYDFLIHRDTKYSEWLAVRESIKKTSIKPSGTVSIVAGVTPGIHWPVKSGYYIRRVRYTIYDPILKFLKEAGYHTEPSVDDPKNTVVVSFPTLGPTMRDERDVSIWEKMELATLAQKYWADNQVSATISFLPAEAAQIGHVLSAKDGQLKGISFLPISTEGTVYAQAPYEPISSEVATEMMSGLKKLDFDKIYRQGLQAEGEKFCNNDSCMIA